MKTLAHGELSQKIISAALAVHRQLGHGFLEKVYRNALEIELREAGVGCNVEVPLKVNYRGQEVGVYYADMIVERKIVVEVKAVSTLLPVHEVQLVNYLKATGMRLGLLINFGQSVKVKRRIFGYDEEEPE